MAALGPVFDHLARCVARVFAGPATGTGFFVAPGQLLTCAHVVRSAAGQDDLLRIDYAGQTHAARLLRVLEGPFPDLALLSVDVPDHPAVLLAPDVAPGTRLYAFGFTERYPGGEPATVEYEGQALLDSASALMKFKGGQIIPGLSGAPLLNMDTWAVAGIVKSTRDRASDLGGGGVSSQTILERLPEIAPLQRLFHNADKRWTEASRLQREQDEAGEQKPVRVIEVRRKEALPGAAEHVVDATQLPARTLLTSLWCPQALAWFAADSIALGSRDSHLRIASPEGRIVSDFKVPESYPSALDVQGGRWLAAVCYTKLLLLDLQTAASRVAELDAAASTYVVRWRRDGRYLATGGTNLLLVFDADLNCVARHHVGGQRGARAVAWGPDGQLTVGLGNGQVWRLAEPFETRATAFQRSAAVHALESHGVDERLAVLWQDGLLEVRRGADVEASIATPGADTFRAGGPRLAWCLEGTVLAGAHGTTSNLLFWRIGAPAYLGRRLDRPIVALGLDPSGSRLALGLDEAGREDGRVVAIETAAVARALEGVPAVPQDLPTPHLFEADWTELIDSIAQDAPFAIKVEVPFLAGEFTRWQASVRQADADAGIKRQLMQRLDRAKAASIAWVDDLRWAIVQMREAGYDETRITMVCDRFASCAIHQIAGRLGIAGEPAIESLNAFIGFVFGHAVDDLVDLDFGARDGRGVSAVVPMPFLLEVDKLMEVGEALGTTHGAASPRQKVFAACQLFHEFDYAFDTHDQAQLWSRYVLPQTLARYPREAVIFRPSDVDRYGLR